MSAVITGKNYLVTRIDHYNKYQTKQYTHSHTAHTIVVGQYTWLGDHQGRPSAPAIHRFTAIDIWRVTNRVIIIIK